MAEQYAKPNRTGIISWGFIPLLLIAVLAAGCSGQALEHQDDLSTQTPEPVNATPAGAMTQAQVEETATSTEAANLEPLIAQLKDADPQLRMKAADELGQTGDARAVDALIAALKDRDAGVRREAAIALGRIKDARAAVPLVELLKDPEYEVRMGAGSALRMLEADAVEPLLAALTSPDPELREQVVEILFDVGDARAVEPLITLLKDEDPDVRSAAAQALGRLKDGRAVEPLIAALKAEPGITAVSHEDTGVQYTIAEALGQIGAPAVEPLTSSLQDSDVSVRKWSAYALGIIRDARAVEPLIHALGDEGADVRANAAQALGLIRDERAVEPLIALLQDEYAFIRREVVSALEQIHTERAVEGLKQAFRDEDWDVRSDALLALKNLGISSLEPLVAALQDGNGLIRKWAAGSLVELKDQRAVDPLLAALRAGDLEVVAGAYRFFISLGEPGTEAVLIQALDQYGSQEMAEAYLNCGNSLLNEAATAWAKEHGYTIKEGSLGSYPAWGSGGW